MTERELGKKIAKLQLDKEADYVRLAEDQKLPDNPYYLQGTDENYYNKSPQFSIWEEGKLAGIKEVLEWIKQFGGLANKVEGEDPEYGHQVQYLACQEGLSPDEYRELKSLYRFVIELSYDKWQSKLKDWGIPQNKEE